MIFCIFLAASFVGKAICKHNANISHHQSCLLAEAALKLLEAENREEGFLHLRRRILQTVQNIFRFYIFCSTALVRKQRCFHKVSDALAVSIKDVTVNICDGSPVAPHIIEAIALHRAEEVDAALTTASEQVSQTQDYQFVMNKATNTTLRKTKST